jgi:hypothetical protein
MGIAAATMVALTTVATLGTPTTAVGTLLRQAAATVAVIVLPRVAASMHLPAEASTVVVVSAAADSMAVVAVDSTAAAVDTGN